MTDNLKHEIFLTNDKPPPRIYVACLASYVAGKLFGKWIDATQPVEDILEQIKQLLADSPESNAEEFEIHGATRCRILKSEETLTPSIGLFPIRRCALSN